MTDDFGQTGPTTMNGPLHTPEADLGDRLITASYSTPAQAEAARQILIKAGIAADRIVVAAHAAAAPELQQSTSAPDQGILGRLREAVLPDDSQTATHAAMRNDDAMLQVRPLREELELVVSTIQSSNPARFDADLERWRNAG